MGVTWLSCCCFVPSLVTHPGGSLPCARLHSGMKTAAFLEENSSHRFGRYTQGDTLWLQWGYSPHQIGSLMSFPSLSAVSQQTWQSEILLCSRAPYLSTHRQHGPWHFAKTSSSSELSGAVQTGKGLREMRALPSISVPGPVPESCPFCWEKSLLGATQRAGEGAGLRLAFGEPVNSPGSGFTNTSLSADEEQKH